MCGYSRRMAGGSTRRTTSGEAGRMPGRSRGRNSGGTSGGHTGGAYGGSRCGMTCRELRGTRRRTIRLR